MGISYKNNTDKEKPIIVATPQQKNSRHDYMPAAKQRRPRARDVPQRIGESAPTTLMQVRKLSQTLRRRTVAPMTPKPAKSMTMFSGSGTGITETTSKLKVGNACPCPPVKIIIPKVSAVLIR